MKLEWQSNPPENLMTWEEALKYAESLGDGWRLPTEKEFEEAFEYSFEGFQFSNYWIRYNDNYYCAWYYNFDHAYKDYIDGSYSMNVRCVREVNNEYYI